MSAPADDSAGAHRILPIDDTGLPKQGTASVGVQRQHCGALGQNGKCWVAVLSALIADGRTWPLAFDLYLPRPWTEDAALRDAVGVPSTVPFREKWRISLVQVRAIQQVGFTITGVVVDADYGTNAAFRAGLGWSVSATGSPCAARRCSRWWRGRAVAARRAWRRWRPTTRGRR